MYSSELTVAQDRQCTSRSPVLALIQAGPRCSGLLSIVRDPDLYSRIADDSSPPAEQFIPPDGLLYLMGTVDEEPASLFVAEGEQIHYMALKPYRRWARDLFYLSILESHMTSMWCEIPTLYPEVINFVYRAGFIDVGQGRTIMKNGAPAIRRRLALEIHDGIRC